MTDAVGLLIALGVIAAIYLVLNRQQENRDQDRARRYWHDDDFGGAA